MDQNFNGNNFDNQNSGNDGFNNQYNNPYDQNSQNTQQNYYNSYEQNTPQNQQYQQSQQYQQPYGQQYQDPYNQQQYQQPYQQPYVQPYVQGDKSAKGFAIASFVLSLVSLFCCGVIGATLAVVFSTVSLKRKPQNNGLAKAGLIIGIISLILNIISVIFVNCTGGTEYLLNELYNDYYYY